jgi:quinoprotein dehydrogenase-associated probable ABC transporter substrate-binding protein
MSGLNLIMKKIIAILLSCLFSITTYAENGGMPDSEYLKVCADPYLLPMSNKKGEGYENKIAELLAEKLGLKVKYEYFPQRMGFIRNTLRAESEEGPGYKCDLVISAPSNFELAATTEPYFTSTYALVIAKGRKLDSITEPSMLDKFVNEDGNEIKIGLPDRGPQQLWVFYNNLIGSMVRYEGMSGDIKVNPGQQMIEDVAKGKIDAAIVWGPTAGYFAKQFEKEGIELVLFPLDDDPEKPQMRFTYSFAMAVRYGEKEWKEKINTLIKENKTELETILTDYGIPLVK